MAEIKLQEPVQNDVFSAGFDKGLYRSLPEGNSGDFNRLFRNINVSDAIGGDFTASSFKTGEVQGKARIQVVANKSNSTPNEIEFYKNDNSKIVSVQSTQVAFGGTNYDGLIVNAEGVFEVLTASTSNPSPDFLISNEGNVIAGQHAALATNATDKFLYIPSSAGTPTGTPTSYTGKVATEYDTTNDKMYAYNSSWKAVGNTTISSICPFPPMPIADNGNAFMDAAVLSNNTVAIITMFYLPYAITATRLSFNVTAVGTAGTVDLGLYSEDGQTKHLDEVTASISATGKHTEVITSTTLNPGIHWLAIVPNGTTNITVTTWRFDSSADNIMTGVADAPIYCGTLTGLTAGTLPATFNPVSSITFGADKSIAFRLDNV